MNELIILFNFYFEIVYFLLRIFHFLPLLLILHSIKNGIMVKYMFLKNLLNQTIDPQSTKVKVIELYVLYNFALLTFDSMRTVFFFGDFTIFRILLTLPKYRYLIITKISQIIAAYTLYNILNIY